MTGRNLLCHPFSMKLTKPIIIGIIVVVVIGALVGGAFVLFPKNSDTTTNTSGSFKQAQKMSPDDIGLSLSVRPDKKGVIMKITKLTGIASVEYDLSYDAKVTDEGEDAVVPKGVSGSPIEVKPGDREISRDLELGTCSKNVCKYDNVVSDISVAIRVNLKSGEVGEVTSKISL